VVEVEAQCESWRGVGCFSSGRRQRGGQTARWPRVWLPPCPVSAGGG
jgi:hypothetical protein